jgi:EH_Signature domain
VRSPSATLSNLTSLLDEAILRLGLPQVRFGQPELLARQAEATRKLANGVTAPQGSRAGALTLAKRFIKGENLDSFESDQLAFVICEAIPDLDDLSVIGSDRLPFLIKHFSDQAKAGELWGPIWRALLISYFNFNPVRTDSEDERSGWESLGKLLRSSWPDIDQRASTKFTPSWILAIRDDPGILKDRPAKKYASDFLNGNVEAISRLTYELGIPSTSWFWHALVQESIEYAVSRSDLQFKTYLPDLIELIEEKKVYRDVSLTLILERYFKCQDNACHEGLRDYAILSWKNPNALEDGMAPGWNHVTKPVWEMVCSWVNENNLRDFFEILTRRASRLRRRPIGSGSPTTKDHGADLSRLNFWSRYIKQIRQTRFVFSDDTIRERKNDKQLGNLISREEGRYARYRNNHAEDAFMMQIGSYLIVEFSNQPNACYVYDLRKLPFEKNAKQFDVTDDLKFGFRGEKAARFTHQDGWENGAYNDLQRLGIYPDPVLDRSRKIAPKNTPENQKPTLVKPWLVGAGSMSSHAKETVRVEPSVRVLNEGVTTPRSVGATAPKYVETSASTPKQSSNTDRQIAPKDAPFSMDQLNEFVAKHPSVELRDERSEQGGRIWIFDRSYQERVMEKLLSWDFEWSDKKEGWYYP